MSEDSSMEVEERELESVEEELNEEDEEDTESSFSEENEEQIETDWSAGEEGFEQGEKDVGKESAVSSSGTTSSESVIGYDQSPFATGLLTPEEKSYAVDHLGEEGLRIVESLIKRAIAFDRRAQALEREKAKSLGVSVEFINRYGDSIEKWLPYIPESMRGTREGYLMALNMAISERVIQSSNPASVYEEVAKLLKSSSEAMMESDKSSLTTVHKTNTMRVVPHLESRSPSRMQSGSTSTIRRNSSASLSSILFGLAEEQLPYEIKKKRGR